METRRIISVVFVDVADSTALGEELDPEDVRFLMARYYEHATSCVTAYGGVVEKFIGDAVVAVFGIRTAEPDDARRAVSCCFSLLESIERDGLLRGRLVIRCGVNTGEVVAVADDAAQNFLASGDVMNTAARIQSVAMPGEVAVGDRTMAAVSEGYDSVTSVEHQLKGKRAPVRVHTLVPRVGAVSPAASAFVGRSSELAVLDALAERVLTVRRPHMVTLFGQSGSGKTRLVHEAARRGGSRRAVVSFSRAGGSSPHTWLPTLRRELVSPRPDVAASVAQLLGRAGLDDRESAAVAATLYADEPVLEHDHARAPREVAPGIASWRILIEAAALDGLLTLIFDDVHEADRASVQLIGKLGSSRSRVPVLIVTTARADIVDLSYDWMETHRHHLALELGPLTDSEVSDLGRQVAPHITDEALLTRTRAAGGNPQFMLELVASCRDDAGAEVGLPANVHSAVQATLDRLSPTAAECARVIAVSDGDVGPSLLWKLLPEHAPLDVRRGLDELLEREVVVVGAEKAYVFVQSLVRDVVYDGLTRADLAVRHARVALVLSGRRSSAGVLRAASHYTAAIDLLGRALVPDYSHLPLEDAVTCLRRAAWWEVDAGYTGFEERAAGFLGSALRICPRAERAEVHEALGDLAGWSTAALASFESARSDNDSVSAGTELRLLRKMMSIAVRGGLARRGAVTHDQLVRWCGEVDALRARADDESELRRLDSLALFCDEDLRAHVLGSCDVAAHELARRVASHAAEFAVAGDWEAASEALDACQYVAMRDGDFASALDANRERLGLPLPAHEMADAIMMSGECLWRLGRGSDAVALVDAHVAGHPTTYSQRPLASVLVLSANLHFEMHRWEELADVLARAETILDELGTDDSDITASAALAACLGVLFTSFRWAVARGDAREAGRIRRRLRASAPSSEVRDRMAFLTGVCDGTVGLDDPGWSPALEGSASLVVRLVVDGGHDHLRSTIAAALDRADHQNGPVTAMRAWLLDDADELANARAELASTSFVYLRSRLAQQRGRDSNPR